MWRKFLIFAVMIFIIAAGTVSAQDINDDAAISYENQNVSTLSTIDVDEIETADILESNSDSEISVLGEDYEVEIITNRNGGNLIVSAINGDGDYYSDGLFRFTAENGDCREHYFSGDTSVSFNLYEFDIGEYPQSINIDFYNDDYFLANSSFYVGELTDSIVAEDIVDVFSFLAEFFDASGAYLIEGENAYFRVYNEDGSFDKDFTVPIYSFAEISPALPVGDYRVYVENGVTGQHKIYWWNITEEDDSKFVEVVASQVGSYLIVSAVDYEHNNITSGTLRVLFENGDGWDYILDRNSFISFCLYDYDPEGYPQNIRIDFINDYYYPANSTIHVGELNDTIAADDVVDEYSFSATFFDASGNNPLVEEEVYFSLTNEDNSIFKEFHVLTDSEGIAVINPFLLIDNYRVTVENLFTGQFKYYWWNITKEDEDYIVEIRAFQDGGHLIVGAVDKDGNNVTSGTFWFTAEDGDKRDLDLWGESFVSFNLYDFDFNGYPQNISIDFTSDDYYPANSSVYVGELTDTIVAEDVVDEFSFNATFLDGFGNPLNGEDVCFTVYCEDGSYDEYFWVSTDSMGVAVINPALVIGNYTVRVENWVTGQFKYYWWNITKEDDSKVVEICVSQVGGRLIVGAVDKDGNNVTSGTFWFTAEDGDKRDLDLWGESFVSFNLYDFDFNGYPQNISIDFTSDDYYPANSSVYVGELTDTIVAEDVVDEFSFNATFLDGFGNPLNGEDVCFTVYCEDGSYDEYFWVSTDSMGVAVINPALVIGNYTVRVENWVTGQFKYYWWNITKEDDSKVVEICVSQVGGRLIVGAVDKDGNNVTSGTFWFTAEDGDKRDLDLWGESFVSFNLYDFDFNGYPQNISIDFTSDDYYPANSSVYVGELTDTIVAEDVVDEFSFNATFLDDSGNPLNEMGVSFEVYCEDGSYDECWVSTDSMGVAVINQALVIGNYTVRVTNGGTGQFKYYWWNITKEDDSKVVEICVSQVGGRLIVGAVDKDGNNVTSGTFWFTAEDGDKRDLDLWGESFVSFNLYDFDFNGYPQNISIDFTSDDYYPANSSVYVGELTDTIVAEDVVDEFSFNATFLDDSGNPLNEMDVSFDVYCEDGSYYNSFYVSTDSMGVAVIDPTLVIGNYTVHVENRVTGQFKYYWWNITKEDDSKVVEICVSQVGGRLIVGAVDKDGNNVTSGTFWFTAEDGDKRDLDLWGESFVSFNLYDFDFNGYPQNISIDFTSDDYYPANSSVYVGELTDTIVAEDVVDEFSFNATFLDGFGNPLNGEDVCFTVYCEDGSYDEYFWVSTDSMGVAVINPALVIGNYTVRVENWVTGQFKYYWWNITKEDDSKVVEICVSQVGGRLIVGAVDKDGNNVTSGTFWFTAEDGDKRDLDLWGESFVSFNLYDFDFNGYPQNISIDFTSDDYYPANSSVYVGELTDTIVAEDVVDEFSFNATFLDGFGNPLNGEDVCFTVYCEDGSYDEYFWVSTDSMGVAVINPALVIGNYTVRVENWVTGQFKYYWWNITKEDDSKVVEICVSQVGGRLIVGAVDKDGNNVTSGTFWFTAEDGDKRDLDLWGESFVSFNLYDFDFNGYPQNISIDFTSDDYYPANSSVYVGELTDTIVAEDVVDEFSFNATFLDGFGNPLNGEDVCFTVYCEDGSYDEYFWVSTDSMGVVVIDRALVIGNYTVRVINRVTGQFKYYWWNITKEDDSKIASINVTRDNYRFIINVFDKDGNRINNGSIDVFVEEDWMGVDVEVNNGTAIFDYVCNDWTSEGEKHLIFTLNNKNYYPVNTTSNFTFRDTINAYYTRDTKFNATFTDIDGNPLNKQEVMFIIYEGGILVDNITLKTDENGFAFIEKTDRYYEYTVTTKNLVTYQEETNMWINKKDLEIIPIAYYDVESDTYIIENETLTFKVSPDATGRIVIYGSSESYWSVDIPPCEFNITLHGSYDSLYVTYGGDKNYSYKYKTVNVLVKKILLPDMTISENLTVNYGEKANFTVNLEYDSKAISNASVKIIVGNDTYNMTTDENGNINLLIDLNAGKYDVSVIYAGSKDYYSVNKTTTLTINKINPTISINKTTIGYGEKLILNVNDDAEGKITVEINGKKYEATINNSKAEIDLNNLGKGIYDAKLIYSGDNNYNNYSINSSITVNPVEISDFNVTANPITAGELAEIEIQLPEDATGNVTVTINGETYTAPIVDGVATVDVLGLTENATAVISYSGDDKYNNASATVDIVVNPKEKENATINIDVPSEATEGDNVTVTVTLPEDATGTVTIGNEVVSVQNGTASAVLTNIPAGNNTVPIVYSGDDKYNPIETEVTINVDEKPVPPKEDLNASVTVDPITVGEDAVIVVSDLKDATGNVTAVVDGKTYTASINDGKATITVPGLVENTTAVISYLGDDKYNNFTESVNIVVNPQPVPPKEDLNASVTVDPITVGEDAVIVVSDLKDATGNVTAVVDGKTYTASINDGKATITVPGLVENTTAVISYLGDDKYNNFTESVDITVNPKENATMNIDIPPVTEGQNTTVNVELPEDATGNVTAVVDGKTYTAPVNDGKATITIPDLAAGNYTVPVTYSGDNKYNPLSEEVKITVDEDKSDIIKAPDVTKYFGGSERFAVTVTDYQGNPLANKSVTILINGVPYVRNTNANGTTSIALGLNSGVYNVTVTMDNKTINSVVTILPTVNGTDIVKIFRNGTQYYATFRDSQGNYLSDGAAVRFNINGVMYDRKVSGKEGLAKLNINLEAGKYIITAMNLVTGESAANNITVLSRLTENADLTKYYRNASQYTVKVLGDDGKAVGAGVSVRFNINGVFYERTTNASGIAKLNINLQAGDYIITAEYNGCLVSNNIKVLPILNASDISMKYRDGTQFKANLVDGQGKPYANQEVTFNINGVFYNRMTDSNGQAKLNINLMPGEYIITSSYNGSSIANKVTVRS